jgi:hypothetical protein
MECPWKEGQSILAFLQNWQANPDKSKEPPTLPDEQELQERTFRFASGALDGIISHHWGVDEKTEKVVAKRVIKALKHITKLNDDKNKARLYSSCLTDFTAWYADAIAKQLEKQRNLGPNDIRPHARWLIQYASHRNPLKLGIVLIGTSGTREDLDNLINLAKYDEFTLYAAVAAANLVENKADVLWEMAKNVNGWGKIHIVEQLTNLVENRDDIKAWLLRHGCENDVMPEYLAYYCATSGELLEALSVDNIDDELIDGTCKIVSALLHVSHGSPSQDIEDYEDGANVIQHLLRHLTSPCNSLERLYTVWSIYTWLEWPKPPETPAHLTHLSIEMPNDKKEINEKWPRRKTLGWTAELREELSNICLEIINRPQWPKHIYDAYLSNDQYQNFLAWQLAPAVQLDLWEEAFTKLEQDPLNSSLYFNLVRTDNISRVSQVIDFAVNHLPLEDIASGPENSLGMEPEFQAHSCLDFLLQEMQRDNVFNCKMVATALRSPVVRNRNMAIKALEKHPVSEWDDLVKDALGKAVVEEPDEEIQNNLHMLVENVS